MLKTRISSCSTPLFAFDWGQTKNAPHSSMKTPIWHQMLFGKMTTHPQICVSAIRAHRKLSVLVAALGGGTTKPFMNGESSVAGWTQRGWMKCCPACTLSTPAFSLRQREDHVSSSQEEKKQSSFLKTIPWATLYPSNTDVCKWQS